MEKSCIAVFLDDRDIFIKTLDKYDYKGKLGQADICFMYSHGFDVKQIVQYEIVFIFLDTCWGEGGKEALSNQIESIKRAAKQYPNRIFRVFPYSTVYRDEIEFKNLYYEFEKEKLNNLTVNEEPFLVRINSDYQMNGIIAMIKTLRREIELKNEKCI